MPYATKAQIERARQPDLLTFLRRYKPDELIPTGPERTSSAAMTA